MNNFAPVLIATLNRYIHFKRCIDSLAACTHVDQTDLFIALDYPRNESHWEGYELIKAYLPSVTGFKTINIIKREKNYGPRGNFSNAIEKIFEKYDRLILSEDDNVFAPSFLDFVNEGLCKFEKNPLVLTVCGYKFPFDVPESFPYNYFYFKGFSAWGFGIWRDRFVTRQWQENSIKKVNRYLHNPWKAFQLNSYQYGLYNGLMNIVKTGKLTGDRMYCFSNLLNGTYSVFPTISKVRNIGHDGSGVNCNKIEKNHFITQEIDTETNFEYSLLHYEYENKIIGNAFKKHNLDFIALTWVQKIKLFLKYLIFWLKY